MINFEDFRFQELDSVQLIRTAKEDLSQAFDTTYIDLSKSHFIELHIDDNNHSNNSYIITDTNYPFKHTITDIHVKTFRSASTSMYTCKEWNYSFMLDSMQYGYDYNHEITINP
jgi:hypothetical protein